MIADAIQAHPERLVRSLGVRTIQLSLGAVPGNRSRENMLASRVVLRRKQGLTVVDIEELPEQNAG
jgi:hypothetical protein